MTRNRVVLGAALLALTTPFDVRAANKSWIGASGNWTTGGNWTPFGAPLDFDNVFIGRADAINRTVTYNVNDGFLHQYNNVVLQPSGAGSVQLNQTGPQFACASLSLSAFGSLAEYRVDGLRDAEAGFLVLGAESRLTVTGGAQFTAGAAQQFGGALVADSSSTFTVNSSYLHNGGTIAGPFRNNGALTITAPAFGGDLENFGSLVLPVGPTTFTGLVTNHTSHTLAADRSIASQRSFTQRGGTFTQLGSFAILGTASEALSIGGAGGATWDQSDANHTGNILNVGSGGPGNYILRGAAASITLNRDLRVGVNGGDGTFAHTGGRVHAREMEIGSTVAPATRGLYTLSSGSLQIDSFFTIANGQFVQTGGFATITRLQLDPLTTGNARLSLSGGSMTVNERGTNNGTITISGNASVVMSDELLGAGSLTVTATSTLEAFHIHQNAVFIGRSARVTGRPGLPPPPHYVQSLTFEPRPTGGIFGQWDLGRASLIIDYGDEPGASPATTIRSYLLSGYAGGSWNGNGLITTGPSFELNAHGLGMAEASDVIGPAGGNFEGTFVDATSLLLRFVRYGDANIDGTVNLADFNRLASNFGASNRIWSQGDFNYDGNVNLQDFNLLAANFGRNTSAPEVTPADWAMLARSIPEPSIALLGIGAFARRRRRATR